MKYFFVLSQKPTHILLVIDAKKQALYFWLLDESPNLNTCPLVCDSGICRI